MNSGYTGLKSADRIVARFFAEYYRNWQQNFPDLNKRAHWNVIFTARLAGQDGVSCRAIHRILYGSYGTDIRTCIERIKDCERDGFVRVFDAANRPCSATSACLIGATDRLREHFDRHCRATIDEIRTVYGEQKRRFGPPIRCDDHTVSAISQFFGGYDRKWRETAETIVRQRRLTPAYHNDAMDHLVTYQYWAIIMLLWSASPFGSNGPGEPALVIDEINSRMWDALRLGHLAIKERVDSLIRWGFFAEETIKKHKAVALTPFAGAAIGAGLAETKALLDELHGKLVAHPAVMGAARSA